ncbi:MAG: exosome complex exonuclease Rrp41 [Candidatus Micrarchaeota archaeon]|nr:exosome complex exonuclease Rrp41 [Candidatus Micrarchaeota archaeon]
MKENNSNQEQNQPKQLFVNGKRLDGRSEYEMRELKIAANVLNSANGSSYIHWGKNKIVVGVYGPKECLPKHTSDIFKAIIKSSYRMAPFCSSEGRDKPGPNRRSIELSKVISNVFEGLVVTEAFPKTEIDIFIEVLQSDGGTRCASITAASVALAHAGIPMKDMVVAIACGKADGKIVLDPSKEEDNFGESDIPMAITVHSKKFMLLQLDGKVKKEELEKALDLALNSVETIYNKQKSALENLYSQKLDQDIEAELVMD